MFSNYEWNYIQYKVEGCTVYTWMEGWIDDDDDDDDDDDTCDGLKNLFSDSNNPLF